MGRATALWWALLLVRVPQTQLAALEVRDVCLVGEGVAGVEAGADVAGAVGGVGQAVLLAPVRHLVVGLVSLGSHAHLAPHYQGLLTSLGVEISDHDSPGIVGDWKKSRRPHYPDICTVAESLLRPTAKTLRSIGAFPPGVCTTPSPLENTARAHESVWQLYLALQLDGVRCLVYWELSGSI